LADDRAKITIDSEINTSGIDKGLEDINKKVEENAEKTQKEFEKVEEAVKGAGKTAEEAAEAAARAVEEASVKQIAAIQSQEREKLAAVKIGEAAQLMEVRKAAAEKIAVLEQAKSGLSESAYNEQLEAVRREEQAKTSEIKRGSREREALIKNEAQRQVKAVKDGEKRQLEEIQKSKRSKLSEIKEFGDQANQSLSKFASFLSTGGLSALGLGVVAAGVKQAVSALNEWGQESLRQEMITSRLNAVLKSTGADAWASSTLLQKLANEQRVATGKSREEIQEMQAVLLGFRSVTKDVFKDATQAVIDMSEVMGQGLVSTANSLGKALDSPVEGMGALSRQGFVFTAQQKELVKVLEETGRHEEAQRVILKEVQLAFSGASMATDDAVRSTIKYKAAMEDLKKNIGTGWNDLLKGPKEAIANFINGFNEGFEKQRAYSDAIEYMGKLTQEATVKINAEKKAIEELQNKMEGASVAETNIYERQIKEHEYAIRLEEHRDERRRWYSEQNITVLQYELDLIGRHGEALSENERAALDFLEQRLKANGQTIEQRKEELALIIEGIKEQRDFIAEEERLKADEEGEQADELDRQKLIGEKRETAKKALEQEIALITKKAKLEGKSVQSEEVQKQILEARVSAYMALVKEIGDAADEERQIFAELRAEYARMEVDAAARLQEENLKNLEQQKQAIREKAELEGRVAGSLETQKELLDAEVEAYGNQLKILRELIDGTAEEETERRRVLQASWDQYRMEQMTAEAQKKRLEEMIKLQDELRKKISGAYSEAQENIYSAFYTADLNKLIEGRKEAEKQGLEEAKKAIDVEAKYRITAAKRARDIENTEAQEAIFNETDPQKIAQMEIQALTIKKSANIKYAEEVKKIYADLMNEQSGWGAADRIEAIASQEIETLRRVNEERKELLRESAAEDKISQASLNKEIEALDQELADAEVEIHEQANEKIKKSNADLMSSLAANMQSYLDSFSQAANSIFSVWNSVIDAELEEELRKNDQIIQSDEEREKKEKELRQEAAKEKYKADLAQWATNIIIASGQAALAVLTSMAQIGLAGAIIAGVVGALNVAAVIAAKPQPPRFHEGGVAQGSPGQEVSAVLRAGETVLTPSQFKDTMAAIAQLAHGNSGGGTSLNVDVKNYASRAHVEKPVFDRGVLHMVIREEVNSMYGSGELDRGIAGKEYRDRGIILE
jgi:hypothetical protein